ncbi:DUF805 domain-containing protein [Salibacterium qingdaonense]|uniref:Uncharacterized membrane protein YhaH, DUF805 family n=1 Tax=Salibacterium qingdaonense TaxID=266892 RepID=A0A1I4LQ57_9BACI|nr:DUF805 domain-containing protein [Salibacterium qingdaonense]SFL93152.1 Uncharacterized membrane protein YhaH, DUF805 family [Salibacterium qingdaonense]
MHWYAKVLSNYAVFRGRARRTEYWMFTLINFLIALILTGIEAMMAIPAVLTSIYGLAVLLPSLGVLIRRLHDTGRTGWWFLIQLIPFIGSIVLLVFMCLDSQEGTNEYGPNPKEEPEHT